MANAARVALPIGRFGSDFFLAGKPLEERLFRQPRDISLGKERLHGDRSADRRAVGQHNAVCRRGKGWCSSLARNLKAASHCRTKPVSLQQLIDDGDAIAHKQLWRVPLPGHAKGELRFAI